MHFSTDIWSSAVVLGGLAAVWVGDHTSWPGPWREADSYGALGVCTVVVFVGGRMVKETIDALLDRAPTDLAERIGGAVRSVPGIVACDEPRLRRVGSKLFADLVVRISRTSAFSQAHALTEEAERMVRA